MISSLVINTAALGQTTALSSGKQPHQAREFALRNFIIPRAVEDGTWCEVIVVGEWEPGDGYRYIPSKSVHHSCVDALVQRQIGFEYSRGDWVCFQHDDHILDWLPYFSSRSDVVVPSRWTRLRRGVGERLNNGEDDGYISGHCAFYRREVLQACPWHEVPEVFTWDKEHTKRIVENEFEIEWLDEPRIWDCEAGSTPWR